MIHRLPCLHKTLCIWLHLSESLLSVLGTKYQPTGSAIARKHQAITDKHTDGWKAMSKSCNDAFQQLLICFSVQKCGCDFTSYLTLSLVQNSSTCINLLDVEIMYFLILFEFSSEHFFSCNLISGLTDGVATCSVFYVSVSSGNVSHLLFYVNAFILTLWAMPSDISRIRSLSCY